MLGRGWHGGCTGSCVYRGVQDGNVVISYFLLETISVDGAVPFERTRGDCSQVPMMVLPRCEALDDAWRGQKRPSG
jgi:hypothetical protein